MRSPSSWRSRHAGTTDFLPLPRPWSFNELDVRGKPQWLHSRHGDRGTAAKRLHLDWYLERFKKAAGAHARAMEE